MEDNMNTMGACGYKSGPLPSCAPLAATFVPMQQENPPKYGNEEALTRGTLFPGLDLPWKNIANMSNPYSGTPLGDLMAIDFVIKELNLYLDTHSSDMEAFAMMKKFLALQDVGQEKYVKLYGPVTLGSLRFSDRYNWTDDPWPWEYRQGAEAK